MQDIFGDLFENFFGGGGGGRPRSRRGHDLKYEAFVGLEEAYQGAQHPMEYERLEACPSCSGTGAKPGTGLKRCSACRGSGKVQFSQGFFSMSQTCSACGGAGQVVETPCRDCRGAGHARRRHKITIRIPAGVFEGATLRIAGEGEAGFHGGTPGDLFVEVHVRPHPRFERENDDLVYRERISFPQAALGCALEVPTLGEGKAKIKLPAGVQHGALLRLSGKGMPRLRGRGFGDLLVRVEIDVPKTLTPRQRDLICELARTMDGVQDIPAFQGGGAGAEDSSKEGGFFGKIFGGGGQG
jgi:molecular chaperone DnaJ